MGFSPVNNLSTHWTVVVIGVMGGWSNLDIELFANCLRLSGECFEKTDSNLSLCMLAFGTGSEWVWPLEFRGAIPMFSVFLCLTKLYNFFLVTRTLCVRKDNWFYVWLVCISNLFLYGWLEIIKLFSVVTFMWRLYSQFYIQFVSFSYELNYCAFHLVRGLNFSRFLQKYWTK